MKRPSSEQMKGMQKQLRTQPEKPIDNKSSSKDNNIKKLSNVTAKKKAYYTLLENIKQSSKSDEEGAAHASTRRTVSLASNESSAEEDNLEKLSNIESEEEAYDIEEDLELSSESEEEEGQSMRGTKSLTRRFMYGADYFEWSVTPPTEQKQTEEDEESVYKPEVLSDAKNKDTPIEIWSLLFTDEMLSIIVEHTNAKIRKKEKNCEKVRFYAGCINLEELKALIGMLYFSVLEKDYGNIDKLWKLSPIFPANMDKARFHYLMALLQFDDKSTRQERRQSDRLAPIRGLWDLFISNCTKYYSPGKNVTIGEQLINYGGKCPFRVKMGPKYEHEGLRIVMMNDSDTYYMINAIPHLGKDDKRPLESMPSYYVRKLSEPIYHSHRNITCNKRFTSVPLVQSMINKYSLSMVGTIRAKEKVIPLKMKIFTKINDSRFLYADNMTLVSYCPKQNKIIFALSSLHKQGDAVVKKKQKIIDFYNSTKEGTGRFNQLCREINTVRMSDRWVIKFFYAMLDQSLANSYILCNLNRNHNTKLTKPVFLRALAINLCLPFIEIRLRSGKLIGNVRKQAEDLVLEIIANYDTYMIPSLTN